MAPMAGKPLKPVSPSSPWPHLPGYEIESVLGRGATGVVYRARQTRVGREVALKVLHPELSGNKRIIQRLQREARTTARLAHPHLVTAVDMGEAEGRWWYAMEFVDGPSLALRLREEGRMSERHALRLFIPLCEALEHLFEHGVVHRDIKPANILIDRAGGARLADLGLAFDDDDDEELTKQGGTLGTPAYISPEQAVDPREADVRSDIWSFGATLFHAVCGRPPFRAESAAEVLSCVLYARVPDPQELQPSLSRGLSLVLRKCLTREPEHRYQTPAELLSDLERIRERRAPRIRRGQLDPVRRRHDPRYTWGVVGAIAIISIVALGWAFQWGRPELHGGGPSVPEETAPFAPLEHLAARAGQDPALLAIQLSELAAMELSLPAAHRARWEEVGRTLQLALQAEGHEISKARQPAVVAALEAMDYIEARALLGERFEDELLARTGFRIEALETEPSLKLLGAWYTRHLGSVEARERADLRRLEENLNDLRTSRFEHVERQVESHEWNRARAELLLDDEQLLAEVGFTGYRFPPAAVAAILDPVRRDIRARRQRLDDDWQRLDQELRRAVIASSEALEQELTAAGRRNPSASTELRTTFGRLLSKTYRLDRNQMPEGLAHVAVAEYEKRLGELVGLEDRLLEERVRAAFAGAEGQAKPMWQSRRYEDAQVIWEEAARLLGEPGGDPGARWRRELAETAALRQEEARLVGGFLEDAARRLIALDGEPITLWVRGIQFVDRRLRAGLDPLADGFQIEGLQERLDLRTLATIELETLGGRGEGAVLSPTDRLLVALLRFRDGDFEGAERVRRAGQLPQQGREGQLVLDLSMRLAEARNDVEGQRARRTSQAQQLLIQATDPVRMDRAPNSVLLWIDELLEDFGDVREVQQRRDELLAIRARLQPSVGHGQVEDFARVFRPTRIAPEGLDRVRMEFEFSEAEAGAWERGEWVFDNLGWTPDPSAPVTPLEALPLQRGPSLILKWPFDAAGEIELSMEIRQPDPDPTRLVTISAMGFHVAFVGTHLPGKPGERLLVETGTYDELLRDVLAGKGEKPAATLRKGRTHMVTLRLSARSGRAIVLLDGKEISNHSLSRPDARTPHIVLRASEKISLQKAVLIVNR